MSELDKAEAWVRAHKVPAIGAGAIGLALVFALAQRAVHKGSTSTQAPSQLLVPNRLIPTQTGLSTGDLFPDGYLFPIKGDTTTPALLPAAGNQQTGATAPPVPATSSPASSTAAPTSTLVQYPLALPQLDAHSIIGQEIVSNPAGSALADAIASGGLYIPSASDYASEQAGGFTRTLVSTQGGPANAYYTVDSTILGSGSVVPVADRITGERYDSFGRVIY